MQRCIALLAIAAGFVGLEFPLRAKREKFTARLGWVPITVRRTRQRHRQSVATASLTGTKLSIPARSKAGRASHRGQAHNGVAKGARGPAIIDPDDHQATSGTSQAPSSDEGTTREPQAGQAVRAGAQ